MDNTASTSAMPRTLTPVRMASDALNILVNNISALKGEIDLKLKRHEEQIRMLDKQKTALVRPALMAAPENGAPYQKAFNAYLRCGDEVGLRALDLDSKAMSTAVNGDGGYLVDPQIALAVRSVLRDTASIRKISNVVNVEATSFDVLIDHGDIGVGWATETASPAETTTPTLDRITIPLHELSALPKASQRLLDDSAFDIDGWLSGRIVDKFARAEAAAFISGDGLDKPRGFLSHGTVDNETWMWGKIGTVLTGSDGALKGPDAIVDLVYALGAQYRASASFVMNSRTAGAVRRLKDNDGRFLWSDGLAVGEPARLLGYPVLIAEDMPDIAAEAKAIAFGDFASGYTIAERPDLRILRDPFSAKPHVLFYATKRIGGDVSDFAAIKLLNFAAS